MSRPIPSTVGIYKPGVGMTITRANVKLYSEHAPPTPDKIVMAFASPIDPESKHYKRLLRRAEQVCRPRGTTAPVNPMPENRKPAKRSKKSS